MRHLKSAVGTGFYFLILFTLFSATSFAADNPSHPLDLVIKIGQIEEKLALIDQLADQGQTGGAPPSAYVNQMLAGTGWVDKNRMIVLGVSIQGDQYSIAGLIPFTTPNAEFQQSMNAAKGPDYYVLGFPPGPMAQPVSKDMELALAAAANDTTGDFVSLEVFIHQLLTKGSSQISQMVETLGERAGKEKAPDMNLTRAEVSAMAKNLIDAVGQIDMFAEHFDFDARQLRFKAEVAALSDSDLFWLLSRKENVRFLNTYTSGRQFSFRIGEHNIEGFADLANDAFGLIYSKMGIDFESLAELAEYFTGEMAGGFDMQNSGIKFEMITVFAEEKVQDDFIDKVYLPWLEKYMESMNTRVIKSGTGNTESLFLRMPDSVVDGHQVYGGMVQIPTVTEMFPSGQDKANPALRQIFFRLAQVDRYLLAAPDDGRISELISKVATFEAIPDKRPFMEYEVDMDAYMAVLGDNYSNRPLLVGQKRPEIGKIRFVTEAKNGKMTTSGAIQFDALKALSTHVSPASSQSPVLSLPGTAANNHQMPASTPESVNDKAFREKVKEEDPAYWADKAGLAATYGNYAGAVRYYEKAIELAPERSQYYYFMGIAQGELGEFQKAIENIDQAISSDGFNLNYLYGRGRVYLQAGDEAAAMRDFKAAADAGNPEAKEYLEYKSRIR